MRSLVLVQSVVGALVVRPGFTQGARPENETVNRMVRSGIVGVGLLGALLLAGCGTGATGAVTTPFATATPFAATTESPVTTATSSPSSSPTATPTDTSGKLVITQLGITMTIPRGLTRVNYEVASGGIPLPDMNGVQQTATATIRFTTPEFCAALTGGCGSGVSEVAVTEWGVDPTTLEGPGYGNAAATVDVAVGTVWLHVESVADASAQQGAGRVVTAQLGPLTTMVLSAVPNQG
jgi:hypothetical protein